MTPDPVQNDIMIKKTEEEWKETLTPKQYEVLREKGTEPKGGKYFDHNDEGMYVCAGCGHELFSSNSKFELDRTDPSFGWPSFDQPTNKENIELAQDNRHGMSRIEVICKNCGSHLGHLFDDGPKETTGEYYCVNSCALNFKKA